jgi:hypothetical protein
MRTKKRACPAFFTRYSVFAESELTSKCGTVEKDCTSNVSRCQLRSSIQFLIAVFVIAITQRCSALELRTYRFVVDGSLPFNVSCGECAPPFLGAKGDIEGTFTVAIDRSNGTGSLLQLNDHLVNAHDLLWSPNGAILQPSNPSNLDHGIIPPWDRFTEFPIPGELIVDGDILRLVSNGRKPLSSGFGYTSIPPYTIEMQSGIAGFEMTLPTDDWYITVNSASAILVSATPEPSCLGLLIVLTALMPTRWRFKAR